MTVQYRDDNQSYLMAGDPDRKKPCVHHGRGSYVHDEAGKTYLDAVGGVHVVTIGHGVAEIADAMANQVRHIAFTGNRAFANKPAHELARNVVRLAPSQLSRVYFVSGGSEANELALQVAQQYFVELGKPSKTRVIGRSLSYHGFTVATTSMGGHPVHRERMKPYLMDFPHISPPYCYRCPYSRTYPQCNIQCAYQLEEILKKEDPDTIAAFIAEPIGGTTAGALVPPPSYYEIIREVCDQYDILFIADEIVTGFGRTGKMFGIEHWTICPDIMTVGKGLSSGYVPIAGVLITDKVSTVLEMMGRARFAPRVTYANHAVVCAATLAVLEYIERNSLVDRCRTMGDYLKCRLEKLESSSSVVGDVRGKGLLLAIEFVKDKKTREPFPRAAMFQERVVGEALDRGVVLIGRTGTIDGIRGDHIMITPPFTISRVECDRIVDVLEASLSRISDVLV